MKKHSILLLLGVMGLGNVLIEAREFRTPLALIYEPGFLHYPLPRPTEDDTCWNYDVWGAGYVRSADQGFTDKHGTKKESLAGIYFGKQDFKGIDAFAPGVVAPSNPFLSFATLSPRFDYTENGAIFGFTLDRAFCCGEWHLGLRTRLPFRSIKVELDSCCDIQQEQLEDVCRTGREHVNNEESDPKVVEDSFAYRLDFLSVLLMTQNQPELLVKYNDNGHIKMDQKDVDEKVIVSGKPPIHVIQRDDGSVPNVPFARVIDGNGGINVCNATPLANSGSGLGNNQRGRFVAANKRS